MGGHALTTVSCTRVDLYTYNQIKADVLARLGDYFDVYPIPEAPEKTDFGDLDVLYRLDERDAIQIIKTVFNPVEIKPNGPVISFAYRLDNSFFQVDLIASTNPPMSLFYFSYGDYGSIIGRMVKPIGLTFGEAGLWMVYENERIMLSSDPVRICEYLDLDYNEWWSGFATAKNMFDHLMRCRFFTSAAFDSDCFNHVYKKRTKKRKVFIDFQEYIADLYPKAIECNDNFIELFNKWEEKEAIDAKVAIIRLHQEKFNGQIFMKYVEPRLINKYKQGFRQWIESTCDFNQWLKDCSIEEIEQAFGRYLSITN